MNIAEQRAGRFIETLHQRGGTLAVSWVNFTEISEVSKKTAAPIVSLLRGVLPRLVFMEVEFGSVVKKENEILAGQRGGTAILHQEFLDVYFGVHRKRSLNPLDPEEFVELLQAPDLRKMLRRTLDLARDETLQMVMDARAKRDLPPMRKNLFALPPKVRAPQIPPTRFAALEGIKYLIKNDLSLETGNHLRDFWHTIVPISFCNYVVLDKAWKEAAAQIQKALMRRKLLTHEAAVYANVDEFLWHFEREVTYRAQPPSG
jgi:hypothetical protein